MSYSSKNVYREPFARHTKLRRKGVVGGFFKGLAFALSAVLVAGIGVGAYAYHEYFGTLQGNSVMLAGQEVGADIEVLPDEEVNILVSGIDKCEAEWIGQFEGRCTEEMAEIQENSYSGQLNDVNMLVHISPEPRRVTVISIPRDLVTARPECQDIDGNPTMPASALPFNEAYGTGGLACVALTAEELTGYHIDHAALMTWGGVIDVTNAIGGVNVCIAQPIKDPIHTHLDLEAGEHTLVGVEALQFLRVRHGVGDGSDLSRISNQQVYMGALVRKLVSDETLGDLGALLRLANAVVHNATLDDALAKPSTMVSIASALKDVPTSEYEFIQFPYVDYAPNPNKVAPDTVAWQQIKAALDANQPLLAQEEPVEPTETPTEEPDPLATETPDPNEVPLPSNIRGSSASDATCSNSGSIF
ncbi:LCP family protein [Microbacterium nanhaiense]|uniref:LCP family protein n=1 Tax=Microbacterium nanhaiense TaxID=1301026 RepID=UPI0016680A1B|nr:LCP family protein [Microbacterium nanhaiense]